MPKVHTLGFGKDITEIRPLVFGKLVEMTRNVVTAYFSDLYHDAIWVSVHINGPVTFYFACGESGTDIGLTDEYLNREHRYRCVLGVSDARLEKWTLTVTGA